MQWANRVAWLILAFSVFACLCLLAYVVHEWMGERDAYMPSVTTPARAADPQNSGW